MKIINGGHDWPSPLSSWGNQDINANTEVWNFVSKFNMNGLINCNSSNNLEIENSTNNNLIRIIDLYGRESKKTSNQLLFYIYENGESIKKFILE